MPLVFNWITEKTGKKRQSGGGGEGRIGIIRTLVSSRLATSNYIEIPAEWGLKKD